MPPRNGPIRAAVYARVSTEEQAEGYSLAAQQRAWRDLVAQRGWVAGPEWIEEGRSARTENIQKRPAFLACLAAAEAREYDVLVVHKVDRFARNRRVAFESFDRLGQAGVGFMSILENMDFTTPWGQFALTMLVGLAQLYSDNLSVETKKGKRERKAQGYWNGLLPFGLTKESDRKGALPVPDRRPLPSGSCNWDGYLLALTSAAEGLTDARIAALLNERGYRTTGNRGANLWRKDSVRRVLSNRLPLGELPGGQPAAHPCYVDRALWERAQAARSANRTDPSCRTPRKATVYSLTGLLRCAWCEEAGRAPATMTIASARGGVVTYCYLRNEGHECPQRRQSVRVYEEQVGAWLSGIALPADAVGRALVDLQAEQPKSDAETERRRIEARLARLRDLYEWGDKTREEYLAERDDLRVRLRGLEPAPARARDLARLAGVLGSAHETWTAVDQAARREMLASLVERIVVRDGVVERITLRPDAARLLPGYNRSLARRSGSDGCPCPLSVQQRYLASRAVYAPDLLAEIAATARATSISAAARTHRVSRQTVRKALAS